MVIKGISITTYYHALRTLKEPYFIIARMLLKLRRDVAVTASGRIYHYVVTYLLLRRDVISPASLAEKLYLTLIY